MLYPLVVLGLVALITVVSGAANLLGINWGKVWLNLALVGIATVLVAIVTEEGFFRGWLWAPLERAGKEPGRVLVWSSVAFSLWHLSAVSPKTGFDLPAAEIPVYMINAAVMGAIWGLLRLISGSVIVASVSHGVWNGGDYVLFGFGTKVGALGVRVFDAALWWWWKARGVLPPDIRLKPTAGGGLAADSRPRLPAAAYPKRQAAAGQRGSTHRRRQWETHSITLNVDWQSLNERCGAPVFCSWVP